MDDGQQHSFLHSRDQIASILKFVSQERLQAYYGLVRTFSDADQRLLKAIRLYERNTQYAEALYPVLQGFEITLRNAVHNQLTSYYRTPEWFSTLELSANDKDSVDRAKKDLADKLQPLTPDHIVGELSLSFWIRLFSSEYEKLLWDRSLKIIVPSGLTRGVVYARFKDIKTLRNRIAHHSRIIGRPAKVRDIYEQILESIGWMDMTVREWVQSMSRADAVLPRPIFERPTAIVPR